MRPAAASATRKKDSSSSSEESDSEDEQPAKDPISSEFTRAYLNCFVCQLCKVMDDKLYFTIPLVPLIIEAKTGTAPTPTTKSVGLSKVAAQKKQESSSEDSSSEDEEPPKVC